MLKAGNLRPSTIPLCLRPAVVDESADFDWRIVSQIHHGSAQGRQLENMDQPSWPKRIKGPRVGVGVLQGPVDLQFEDWADHQLETMKDLEGSFGCQMFFPPPFSSHDRHL